MSIKRHKSKERAQIDMQLTVKDILRQIPNSVQVRAITSDNTVMVWPANAPAPDEYALVKQEPVETISVHRNPDSMDIREIVIITE